MLIAPAAFVTVAVEVAIGQLRVTILCISTVTDKQIKKYGRDWDKTGDTKDREDELDD
jgi:hypothetical protein